MAKGVIIENFFEGTRANAASLEKKPKKSSLNSGSSGEKNETCSSIFSSNAFFGNKSNGSSPADFNQ